MQYEHEDMSACVSQHRHDEKQSVSLDVTLRSRLIDSILRLSNVVSNVFKTRVKKKIVRKKSKSIFLGFTS